MGFLKDIFGPSKDEIWGQIADEIDGEFIDGGFWKKDALTFRHKEWEIMLDTFSRNNGNSSQTYTRIRVPFINKDQFRFRISNQHFFAEIGKFFGMQDIEIGDKAFDDRFIIKSNNEPRVKRLLEDREVKELLMSQKTIFIHLKDNEGWFGGGYPENVDVLYFERGGIIKDRKTLAQLFLLFTEILDRLVEIDSAYESNPRFRLK